MAEELITHSAEETVAWGRALAKHSRPRCWSCSAANWAAAKPLLTKGIVAGLKAAEEDEVTSPTFTLLHEYGPGGKVFHGDLYRVESFHDFETLGMEDVFAKPAIVILEWSEKFPLKTEWPQIRLRLEHLGGDARKISRL